MTALALLRFWREGLIGALLLVIGVQHFALAGEKRHSAKVEKRLTETEAAYSQFQANVRAAQAKASADNKAHVAAVTRQQEQITSKVESDYAKRLAELRARYNAVRVQRQPSTPAADRSAAGTTGVPGVPASPGEPDAATIACEVNTLQLEGLQQWVREQEGVR